MQKTPSSSIKLEVAVPTQNFYTWQSATLFSQIQVLYEPSELDDLMIQRSFQLISVSIDVDFLTLSRLELDFNFKIENIKHLKRVLKKHFQQCNAKVKSLEIPEILWQKNT